MGLYHEGIEAKPEVALKATLDVTDMLMVFLHDEVERRTPERLQEFQILREKRVSQEEIEAFIPEERTKEVASFLHCRWYTAVCNNAWLSSVAYAHTNSWKEEFPYENRQLINAATCLAGDLLQLRRRMETDILPVHTAKIMHILLLMERHAFPSLDGKIMIKERTSKGSERNTFSMADGTHRLIAAFTLFLSCGSTEYIPGEIILGLREPAPDWFDLQRGEI